MLVVEEARSILDLAPYFGLTNALYPADFEKEFLLDCDYDPTGLEDLVVRLVSRFHQH